MASPLLSLRITPQSRRGTEKAIPLTEVPALASRLEESGLFGLYLAPSATVDALSLLGACAATTTTLTLGCCPLASDGRLPSVLAKVATGLDVLSSGRVRLVFSGVAVDDTASYRMLNESMEIVRAMVRVPAPHFSGEHFTIAEAWNEPRATTHNGVPIGLFVETRDLDDLIDSTRRTVLDLATQFGKFLVISTSEGTEEDFVNALTIADDFVRRSRRSGRVRSDIRVIANVAASTLAESGALPFADGQFDEVIVDASQITSVEQVDQLIALLATFATAK